MRTPYFAFSDSVWVALFIAILICLFLIFSTYVAVHIEAALLAALTPESTHGWRKVIDGTFVGLSFLIAILVATALFSATARLFMSAESHDRWMVMWKTARESKSGVWRRAYAAYFIFCFRHRRSRSVA
jgi:hypothetical protein